MSPESSIGKKLSIAKKIGVALEVAALFIIPVNSKKAHAQWRFFPSDIVSCKDGRMEEVTSAQLPRGAYLDIGSGKNLFRATFQEDRIDFSEVEVNGNKEFPLFSRSQKRKESPTDVVPIVRWDKAGDVPVRLTINVMPEPQKQLTIHAKCISSDKPQGVR